MSAHDGGLLSQPKSPSMPVFSRSFGPQSRWRWFILVIAVISPFVLYRLWRYETSFSPIPSHPPVTTVDPALPFKDSRPRPSFINSPAAVQDAPVDPSIAPLITTISTTDRPLILYAIFENELTLINLRFFLKHALHDAADFIFVFNGNTNAYQMLPQASNIKYVRRENKCYDLGAFAEILLKDDLYKKYNRFITMNASIRGPFLPRWAWGACWSDTYLNLLTDEVKLVGMTMNCENRFYNHIQSMIWATDRVGLDVLLFPNETAVEKLHAILDAKPMAPDSVVPKLAVPGINSCPEDYWDAVAIEVYATPLMKAAGYKVAAMSASYHGSTPEKYEETCGENGDIYAHGGGGYWGGNIHPFDTLFAKTNRALEPDVLAHLTTWMDGAGYSSYDFCR